jgi:hypothetical protein
MYEMTHKGAWFKWQAFNRDEKRLAAIALIGSGIAGAVLGVHLAISGILPNFDPEPLARLRSSPWDDVGAALAIFGTLMSAFAWWRLSIRQDELFNRVQNYAIGVTGAVAMAIVFIWWLMTIPGWVGPLPLGWFVLLLSAMLFVAQALAVRRWA